MGLLMRSAVHAGLGTMLLMLLGCGAEAGNGTTAQCGNLLIWEMPEDEVLPLPGQSDTASVHRYYITVTKARLNMIAVAAERYCRLHDRYPNNYQELLVPRDTTYYPSCALTDAALTYDAWNRQIKLEANGIPRLVSAGPDGYFETNDDIHLPSSETGDKIELSRECPRIG